jgi:cytochrome c
MKKILAVALLSGVLGLAACSQQESTSAPETPTVEAPAPEAAPEAAEPEAAVELVSLDIVGPDGQQMSGDPSRGQRIFAQCATCHSVEQGVNRVGPSLYGIIGRTAGSVAGFRYSEANRNSGIVWSEQEMFVYLENPRARVPGTIMAFVGLRDPQQRADVIAYLQENAGN